MNSVAVSVMMNNEGRHRDDGRCDSNEGKLSSGGEYDTTVCSHRT